MKLGHEVDKVKLYNFMKTNDIKQNELSKMLGKSACYISQVMTGRQNLSDDVFEQLAHLMECDEEELYAKPDTPYSATRKAFVKEEDESPRPTFEERMEDRLMTDEERRNKFFSSQAFRDMLDKQNETDDSEDQNLIEETTIIEEEEPDEPIVKNPADRMTARIEALTNFLSKAIMNGRKHIGTAELVNILLE